jgi:peptide-methionine (S)-S-oxide reductase
MDMKRLFLAIILSTVAGAASAAPLAKATFAGGCFWCMEPPFEKLPGVVSVVSGYTGGTVPSPTYEQVSSGNTGHYEAVEITYDPAKVSYEKLLDVFWPNVDPTDGSGQFCDKGPQYRAAIFYRDDNQRKLAEASRDRLKARFPNIRTQVLRAAPFYKAEEYHQDYYKKNPIRYKFYRNGCRRDARLAEVWGG